MKMKTKQEAALAKHRTTSQRRLLLDIMHSAEGHLDADELYRRARERKDRLSLSTVYRNLQLFKKLGLVEEHHFEEGRHCYELKPSVEHHHLICLGCGRVEEFTCPETQYMKEKVAKDKNFKIISTEVRMTGFCSACRRKKRGES
jgi:Fe2+ or Zn2+ uptake regulation protein